LSPSRFEAPRCNGLTIFSRRWPMVPWCGVLSFPDTRPPCANCKSWLSSHPTSFKSSTSHPTRSSLRLTPSNESPLPPSRQTGLQVLPRKVYPPRGAHQGQAHESLSLSEVQVHRLSPSPYSSLATCFSSTFKIKSPAFTRTLLPDVWASVSTTTP